VDEATRKRLGKLVGPAYLLTGQITSIRKKAARKTDLYFLFTLNLIELETGLIRWAGEKEIRKDQKKPLVGW
jgi:penicillin-binding protein activator